MHPSLKHKSKIIRHPYFGQYACVKSRPEVCRTAKIWQQPVLIKVARAVKPGRGILNLHTQKERGIKQFIFG